MKTEEWHGLIRNLLFTVQFEPMPWERTDLVLPFSAKPADVQQFRRKYGQAIQEALKNDAQLSALANAQISSDAIQAFLEALWHRIGDLPEEEPEPKRAPAPAAVKAANALPTMQAAPEGKLLIGVDFDGTIVEHKYPDIGNPLPEAFETLKALQKAGHRLVLTTCRENHPEDEKQDFLTQAVQFCRDNGIEFVSVNENLEEDDFRPGGGRKVYANIYIDDRNLGGFPGWSAVKKMILGNK